MKKMAFDDTRDGLIQSNLVGCIHGINTNATFLIGNVLLELRSVNIFITHIKALNTVDNLTLLNRTWIVSKGKVDCCCCELTIATPVKTFSDPGR